MSTIAPPKPITSTADTITFARSDWDAFIDHLENADDLASVRAYDAWVMSVGADQARRLSYTVAEMERMIDGVSAVTIWRSEQD